MWASYIESSRLHVLAWIYIYIYCLGHAGVLGNERRTSMLEGEGAAQILLQDWGSRTGPLTLGRLLLNVFDTRKLTRAHTPT